MERRREGGERAWRGFFMTPPPPSLPQCVPCLRSARGDAARTSYHCGPECLKAHWPFHKELHETKRPNGEERGERRGKG